MKTLFRATILNHLGFNFPERAQRFRFLLHLAVMNFAAAISVFGNSADALPTVSIRAVDAETVEPSPNTRVRPGRFVLTRSFGTQALTVFVSFDGSATYGLDYEKVPQFVEFSEGQTEVELLIGPLDDVLIEEDETVVVHVEPSPFDHLPDYQPDPNQHDAKVVIHDNGRSFDHPVLALAATVFETWEARCCPVCDCVEPASNPAVFTITRRGPNLDQPLTAVVRFSGTAKFGADYTVFSEGSKTSDNAIFATFPAGMSSVDLSVHALWDNEIEPDEVVLATLETLSGAASDVNDPDHREAKVLIHDAVTPMQPVVTVEALDPDAAEMGANGQPDVAVFRFSRTGSTDFDQPVYFGFYCPVCLFAKPAAENGVDFEKVPTAIVIPKGSVFADLVIKPIPDQLIEGDEPLPVWIEEPRCILIFPPPKDCYLPGKQRMAIGTIHDQAPVDRAYVTILKPEPGATFVDPEEIIFEADTFDPKGAITHLDWFAGDRQIGSSDIVFIRAPDPGSRLTHEFHWKNPPAGEHLIVAIGHNADGEHVINNPRLVRVMRDHPGGEVATLEVTEPKEGQPFSVGDVIRISVTAIDPKADIRRVEFYDGADLIGVSEQLTKDAVIPGRPRIHIFEWSGATPGEHELSARALDSEKQLVRSKPVHVQVGAAKGALSADIARIERLPNGQVQLILHGDPAKVFYDLEVSSDLKKWEKVGAFTPGNFSFSYLDENASHLSARFYRAIERSTH